MRLPVIRYPLFWIAGIAACVVGYALARPAIMRLGDVAQARLARAVAGPPVPRSAEPARVAGAVLRTALVLDEGLPVADRPGGVAIETLGSRLLARVYDVWPDAAAPSHFRIGNDRRAFGWVPAGTLLPWDTRLVLRTSRDRVALAPAGGQAARAVSVTPGVPLPVLSWRGDAVEVAVWEVDAPWSRVAARGWVRLDDFPTADRGVLLGRAELLALIRSQIQQAGAPPGDGGLRARIGRLAQPAPLSLEDTSAARSYLPAWALATSETPAPDRLQRLAARNQGWKPDAAWSGVSFMFLPLQELP